MSSSGYPALSYPTYYGASVRGNVFLGANQAVVGTALQTGLTTAAAGGLILYNPLSNKNNLAVLQASVALEVVQSNVGILALGTGYSASVAPTGTLTVVASVNAISSGAPATGSLYSSASITLPVAPVLALPLSALETGAVTTQITQSPLIYNVDGRIVVPPGGYVCFVSTAAGTASSCLYGFVWAEYPV